MDEKNSGKLFKRIKCIIYRELTFQCRIHIQIFLNEIIVESETQILHQHKSVDNRNPN